MENSSEYLRRNLVVANAVGIKSAVARALNWEAGRKTRLPLWCRQQLWQVEQRIDDVIAGLIEWRDSCATQ